MPGHVTFVIRLAKFMGYNVIIEKRVLKEINSLPIVWCIPGFQSYK
jgi:hypothetical protein